MTTAAAAEQYKMDHILDHQGRPIAIWNPHGGPVDELPVIYGFNNGGRPGWLHAMLLAEDGEHMGDHCCSDEVYMPCDLGILEGTRPDRHETFRAKYPDGYRMEFVSYEDCANHDGLHKAAALNQEAQITNPKEQA